MKDVGKNRGYVVYMVFLRVVSSAFNHAYELRLYQPLRLEVSRYKWYKVPDNKAVLSNSPHIYAEITIQKYQKLPTEYTV